MPKLIKNLMLVAMLGSSIIETIPTASAMQSAVGAANPLAKPEVFTNSNPFPDNAFGVKAYVDAFVKFANSTDEGKLFIQEKMSGKTPPANINALRQEDPASAYKLWYIQKYESGQVSQAQLQQIEQQATQQATQQFTSQLNTLKAETQQYQQQLAVVKQERDTYALSGNFSNKEAQQIMNVFSRKSVSVTNLTIDETAQTIKVEYEDGGTAQAPLTATITDPHEFNRIKILLSIFNNMYSKSFNAASGAMGDLVSDILSSAQPQDYHFKQIAQLTTTTSTLDKYLKYHQKQSTDLAKFKALPLKNFLNIKFLPRQQIEDLRVQILNQFNTIISKIPEVGVDNYPLGSAALRTFIDKIRASIMLPTMVSFSNDEVAAVFKELGILLETEGAGKDKHVVIDSNYYTQLGEFGYSIAEIKKVMKKSKEDYFNSSNVQVMFKNVEAAIIASDITKIPLNLKDICDGANEQFVGIVLGRVLKLIEKLKTVGVVDISMPYQDAGLATADIKAGGNAIEPIKAVLFLLKNFAPEQFNEVAKSSILGDFDSVVQAACSKYYGNPIAEIKKALLEKSTFMFSQEDYKSLKSSESLQFIKTCLDSVLKGSSLSVDLEDLKNKILGINTSPAAKIRTALIIRTCELINLGGNVDVEGLDTAAAFAKLGDAIAITKKLDQATVKKATKGAAYFNNPEIDNNVLMFDIQMNALNNDKDKQEFLGNYLKLNNGVKYDDKVINIGKFFAQSLAASAKESDLVKLVLTLPAEKQQYIDNYKRFEASANNFETKKGEQDFKDLNAHIASQKQKGTYNEDQSLILERTLGRITKLQAINGDFLKMGDQTAALVTSDKKQGSYFKVTAGLKLLDFDAVFAGDQYFGAFFNAVKILHFIELSMPSDEDFDGLTAIILDKADAGDKAVVKANIDALIACSKALKVEAVNFYNQIAKLMKFVEDFDTQKAKYNVPTGTEKFDFYANMDKLGGGAPMGPPPMMPGMMGMAPPLMMAPGMPMPGLFGDNATVYGANTGILTNVLFKDDDGTINTTVYGKKFNKQSVKPDELNFVMVQKVNLYYRPILDAQLEYFRSIDFTKIQEADVVPLVRQLLVCIDLYLRMYMVDQLHIVDGAKLTPESRPISKLFVVEYLKVFDDYTIRNIYNSYKSAKNFTDANTNALTKMLKKVNPELRAIIGNAIIEVFRGVDMANPNVNVIDPILHSIEPYLNAHPLSVIEVKNISGTPTNYFKLTEAAIRALVKLPK